MNKEQFKTYRFDEKTEVCVYADKEWTTVDMVDFKNKKISTSKYSGLIDIADIREIRNLNHIIKNKILVK